MRRNRKVYKSKGQTGVKLSLQKYMQDLAFMANVTEHLNTLNKQLQRHNKIVTQFYDSILAFKLKLSLWETQLANADAAHFPCLKHLCLTQEIKNIKRFKDKITGLLQDFEQLFQIFSELEKEFKVFSSPIIMNLSDLPVNIQLKTIDLQCDLDLKNEFAENDLNKFYQYYPNLIALAAKLLSMFGTTYLFEQIFSVMNINKTNLHSRPVHTNLNHILKLTVTQNVAIDIDTLVKAKRCQVSGAK